MKIIVADTETSGMSRDDGICQLAFVEVNPDLEVIAEWDGLIDPEAPITPGAQGVHGISDEDVKFAPTMQEAMDAFLIPQFGSFDDILLSCHNIPFDSRFLRPYWGITNTFCTLKASRKVFPNAPDHKLRTLQFYLGLREGISEAHSAKDDVAILLLLLRKLIEESGMDLFDLVGYHIRPQKVTHMPWGKHVGMALTDLPFGYKNWLLALPDLDDNLRWSLTS